MVDVILIVSASIFSLIILVSAGYFVIYYQSPDDKWTAWFPKIVVVLGLSIASFNILLLPLDVANQKGEVIPQGGLPIKILSLSFLLGTILFAVLIVPFTSFYYEGLEADPENSSRLMQIVNALKWMIPVIVLFGGLVGGLYWVLGFANVPVDAHTSTISPMLGADDTIGTTQFLCANAQVCAVEQITEKITINIIVFAIAIAVLIGYLLFATFGGIGMVALPVDLVRKWTNRPTPLTTADYAEKRRLLAEETRELMGDGRELQKMKEAAGAGKFWNAAARQFKSREKTFVRNVAALEEHYLKLEEAHKEGGGNILVQFGALLLGILGFIFSLAWTIHTGIYTIPVALDYRPLYRFLNEMFKAIANVPFVGTALYTIMVFWLLLATVKGNAKMGMRLVFIKVHPLKIGDTVMTSMLFNVGLILFASLAIAQFTTVSLADYLQNTPTYELMGVQIKRLTGVEWALNAMIFLFAAIEIITAIIMIIAPIRRFQHAKKNA